MGCGCARRLEPRASATPLTRSQRSSISHATAPPLKKGARGIRFSCSWRFNAPD
ncbi:hypothetical protein [Lysobacter gummosus]|uniref:hypothetical protein n=1 Tax=Lysobacter gummosus TaxID=262324 RepID=UPI003633E9A8